MLIGAPILTFGATIWRVSKKPKGFHTPFEKLDALKKELADQELAKKMAPRKPPPIANPSANTASAKAAAPVDDERAFADEMLGVAPLAPDPRGRRTGVPGVVAPHAPRRRVDDEAEAYAELADLVEGGGTFDVTATDEYIEGLAQGIDKRLLRKLRAGDYAVQAHLDLHGLTSDEARVEVDAFLARARGDGRRCVLVVHGRGHNSKEGVPVLKERLQVWLTRGRIGRGVLAFCTARPADGGAGAVYVLLRR
jgi:DNA-nicking Smr family endonuclease